MSLRFGTYTEFQSEPHGDHPKIVWDHIEVGVQADQTRLRRLHLPGAPLVRAVRDHDAIRCSCSR